MSPQDDRRIEVLFDMTRTAQRRGRMVGTVRVESELAAQFLASPQHEVRPVAWSGPDEHFVELSLEQAHAALSSADGIEFGGPRIESTLGPDPRTRRILLVTGNGWLSNAALLHGTFHLRGVLDAELHVLVHDLVHARFPQWSPHEEALKSGSAQEAMLAGADRILALSDATAADIAEVSRARGIHVRPVTRAVNGTTVLATGDEDVTEGLESLASHPFVLYVSSVAARKNHVFLVQVWERLVARAGPSAPRLVLVGQVATDQASLMERLVRTAGLEDHLVHVSSASDADLAWLYRHCAFTVFPSLYEGWGLPVVESLALGKVCIASNTSSIPEIVGDVIPLLDPLDAPAWVNAIERLAFDPDALSAAEARIRDFHPVTWPEAASRLWEAIVPPLEVGSASDRERTLAAGVCPDVVATEPWQTVRNPAGSPVARRRRQSHALGHVAPHGVGLHVTIAGRLTSPTYVETEVNGIVIDGCVLDGEFRATRRLDVPRDVLVRRGLLDIVTVERPLEGALDAVPVSLDQIDAVELTAAEERAAIDARRDAWRMNDTLVFTAGSPHLALLRRGWGEPAHWGTWSVEPFAAIGFRPMPQPGEPLIVRALVRGFVTAARPSLDADVIVNGRQLATWRFMHPADFSFVVREVQIPPEVVIDGAVELLFAITGATSPKDLGLSHDDRQLGIGLARAHCATLSGPPPEPGWTRLRR